MQIIKETDSIIVYINDKGRKCWRLKERDDAEIIERVVA